MKLKFFKLSPDAQLPTQSKDDVGFDLYALHGGKIPAFTVGKISTGIASAEPVKQLANGIFIEANAFLKIEGRSGLASKGQFPVGGIVDLGYRGDLCVMLYNGSTNIFEYKKGDRIGQLVCYLCYSRTSNFEIEIEEVFELQQSDRGDKGFGSSGS